MKQEIEKELWENFERELKRIEEFDFSSLELSEEQSSQLDLFFKKFLDPKEDFPEGERHSIIEKNFAIYILKNRIPLNKIKQAYKTKGFKINSLLSQLKGVQRGTYKGDVSVGELVNWCKRNRPDLITEIFNNEIKFQYETEHLPCFEQIKNISRLQGEVYTPILKGVYYFILGRLVFSQIKKVVLGDLVTDPRIHLFIPIPSGQGKKNLKTTIKLVLDKLKFKGYCPTSIHPEQLIGKVINRGTPKNPKWVKNLGYFSQHYLIFDEIHHLLVTKDQQIQECRKNLRIGKDTYGENLIEKKSVDNLFEEEEMIQYYASFCSTGFTQKKPLPSDIVEAGDLRRDLVLFVKELENRDKTEDYENRLNSVKDIKEELKVFKSFADELLFKMEDGKFTFDQEAITRLVSLHREIMKVGFASSEKGANFSKMVDFTLQDFFVKLSCLLGAAHGKTKITKDFVELAFMDLLEFFDLQLSYVKHKIMGKLDYGDTWGGAQDKDSDCLEWLYNEKATSKESSNVSIQEFKEAIMKIRGIKEDMAKKVISKYKNNNWIKTKQEFQDSKVWLAFKPAFFSHKLTYGCNGCNGCNAYRNVFSKFFTEKYYSKALSPLPPLPPLKKSE